MTIIELFFVTLVPSGIFTAIYFALGMIWQGIPSIALFFILSALTLFVYELSVVLTANRREYGKVGLQIVFSKCGKMAWWKVFLYGLALFGIAGIISITVGALEDWIFATPSKCLYEILPEYFNWSNFELVKQYPKSIVVFTAILYFVMNVLICPIVEEIYFRGYLTERMSSYGIAAPILVSVAFSFYHWWLPSNNIFRICTFAVAFTVAYKKENIYISMVFHCLCNLLSSISFITALLN